MKYLLSVIFFSVFAYSADGQILKRIKDRVKQSAENEIMYETERKVNKAIDEILNPPQKPEDSKKSKKAPATEGKSTQTGGIEKRDGFLTMNLSASQIIAGGSLTISGQSVRVENENQVLIKIAGPSVNENYKITLSTDNRYIAVWYASGRKGKYKLTVTSPGNKAIQSGEFEVVEEPLIDNQTEENIEITTASLKEVKKKAEELKQQISDKDAAELEKKLALLEDKVNVLLKVFTSLNTAGKEVSRHVKSGKQLTPQFAENLNELNQLLKSQAEDTKSIMESARRAPADNTVCEYIVMVNEACAAFSTVTNFWTLSLTKVLGNIVIDKVIPKTVEVLNPMSGSSFNTYTGFWPKEGAKIFAMAKLDAESLKSKTGKAGIAGDFVQYLSDVLLKIYCGVYKGNFKHDYTIKFRNEAGEVWWSYGVEMEAILALRYPKDKGKGNIIQMKGNLEGNATKFSFFTDIAREDEVKSTLGGKAMVKELQRFTPPAVPFSVSKNDILGFGAVARNLITPASFYIPVDAEYNRESGLLKINTNEAVLDFMPTVKNELVYLFTGAGLPMVYLMGFPIHKARLTIKAALYENNEFKVTDDSKGNEQFSGKGNVHLGDGKSQRETFMNFSIEAKKDL